MRVLLIVLTMVNVAFFAWAAGWLAPHLPAPWQGQREPHRLSQQFEPQRIVVRPAASAVTPGDTSSSTGLPPASQPASAPASASLPRSR